jgi:hypothetical protein
MIPTQYTLDILNIQYTQHYNRQYIRRRRPNQAIVPTVHDLTNPPTCRAVARPTSTSPWCPPSQGGGPADLRRAAVVLLHSSVIPRDRPTRLGEDPEFPVPVCCGDRQAAHTGDKEKRFYSGDEGEILGQASGDGTENVGSESSGTVRSTAEALGKDHPGREDGDTVSGAQENADGRCRARQQVPGNRIVRDRREGLPGRSPGGLIVNMAVFSD